MLNGPSNQRSKGGHSGDHAFIDPKYKKGPYVHAFTLEELTTNNSQPRVNGMFMSEPGEPLLLSHTNHMYDDAAQAVDASF